ncbi:hypothetical protein [Bittarella massiliensis (ex Durand et al. 2017)]|uniref:GNAT family N-acetyltransferase n=1 Tax=Bittarella massiliensis (ex Durand et al. 2017) TaxID=1720313 RepID=A0AAW5KE26_9FIRM|nr:hypothetical protein [Bittarella massiliensis (ex Durand et al. 2017)]MCQ4949229.1 hypothetical protein [Bittarella massiliensis (ex Durand et al. 2017)]
MSPALGRAMAAREGGEIAGWLRWDLLWDNTPFLNLLSVVAGPRGRNGAARLLRGTDERGRAPTFSLSSEGAQRLHRRRGYTGAGALLLPGEVLEIFFVKAI